MRHTTSLEGDLAPPQATHASVPLATPCLWALFWLYGRRREQPWLTAALHCLTPSLDRALVATPKPPITAVQAALPALWRALQLQASTVL
eukprot:4578186-Lingulodinium_polyedra.AAC.1